MLTTSKSTIVQLTPTNSMQTNYGEVDLFNWRNIKQYIRKIQNVNGQKWCLYLAAIVTKIHIHTGFNQKRDYLKINPTKHNKPVNTKNNVTYD